MTITNRAALITLLLALGLLAGITIREVSAETETVPVTPAETPYDPQAGAGAITDELGTVIVGEMTGVLEAILNPTPVATATEPPAVTPTPSPVITEPTATFEPTAIPATEPSTCGDVTIIGSGTCEATATPNPADPIIQELIRQLIAILTEIFESLRTPTPAA